MQSTTQILNDFNHTDMLIVLMILQRHHTAIMMRGVFCCSLFIEKPVRSTSYSLKKLKITKPHSTNSLATVEKQFSSSLAII